MATTPSARADRPPTALRQFMRQRTPVERCELCGLALVPEHQHLLEPANRQLHCCCDACAILFSGQQSARYRRVPRRVRFVPDFRLTDAQWEELYIPINLAFFFHSSPAGRVIARVPQSRRRYGVAPDAGGVARPGGGEPDTARTGTGCRSATR